MMLRKPVRLALLSTLFVGSALLAFIILEATVQSFPEIVPVSHRYLAHRLFVKNVGDLREWMNSEKLARNIGAFQFDSELGWIGVPNVGGTNWSLDGEFGFKTNSRGFRDEERDTMKPPEKFRIAVVGDSFIWGHNLDQSELMTCHLERELRARGYNVEVLNFGIGGYGTDQEYLLVEREVLRYRPDIVALSFFYSNDFWNNYEEISSQKAKPYFRFRDDGALELRPLRLPRLEQQTNSNPHQARFFGSIRSIFEERSFVYNLAIRNRALRSIARVFGLTSAEIGTADSGIVSLQQSITKRLILMMKEKVEAAGAAFFVFMYPGYGYYYGDQAQHMQTLRFFRSELRQVPLLDLAPAFDTAKACLYHFYSEHWNREGSQLAGIEVAHFVENRWLKKEAK